MSRTGALAISMILIVSVPSLPAMPPVEDIVRDVEFAFQDAMEMWAYRQFWRLWEVSSSESRFAMSQTEFADLMERGSARPAAGRRVEEVRTFLTSPETAVVHARMRLEDPGSSTPRSLVRSFLFHYQDGRWRPQLSDFLGLASYAFPLQPFVGPGVLIAPCCPIPRVPVKPPPTKAKPAAPCCFIQSPPAGLQVAPRR